MEPIEKTTWLHARALTIEINECMNECVHVPERVTRPRRHVDLLQAFNDQQDEMDRLAAQLHAAEGVIKTQARELNRLRRALLPAEDPAAPASGGLPTLSAGVPHPEGPSSGLAPTAVGRLSWWRRPPSRLADAALCA